MIKREPLLQKIKNAFRSHRIVCLLGPRQCGKTTLARQMKKEILQTHYFDLEKPSDLKVFDAPDLSLPSLKGFIIIDEIQRRPELFPYLRYLHDEELDQNFLILGSASRELIQQSSESLAGRIAFIEITPFSFNEVQDLEKLWIYGGFPKSYLVDQESSILWRENYMRTYVEHDLAILGFSFQTDVLRKLWFMLAHYHGQVINYAELAASLGVSQPTIKKYISYLSGSFMLRSLQPWHANLNKRQVKSPKIYFRDSGLLHYVLNIKEFNHIFKHPKAGASFEGFAMEEIIRANNVDSPSCYFWGSHNKAELDLLLLKDGKKSGFEFKLSDSPKLTPSMKIVMKDLELDSLTVIYPKGRSYKLTQEIQVISLEEYLKTI